MDLDNWIVQLRKGILELCILNSLKQKEYYGYNLVKKLISIKGLEAKEGSIYPLLSRLKLQNLVTTRLEESNEGPVRKYYSLTDEGKEFTEMINYYFKELVNEVNLIMEGDKKMNNWTKKAEIYFNLKLDAIKKSLAKDEVNVEEVVDDIKNHVNEKINEKKLTIITENDIEAIFIEMGFNQQIVLSEEVENGNSINKNKIENVKGIRGWLFSEISFFKLKIKNIYALLFLIFVPVIYISSIFVFTTLIFPYGIRNIVGIILLFSYPIFFIVLLLIIIKMFYGMAIEKLIFFSLLLSGSSFFCEIVLKFNVFPDFSFLTIVLLLLSFLFLGLSTIYKFIPKYVLILLLPFLVLGMFVCIPFIIYLFPAMLFSWLISVFLIGLLPYSSLFFEIMLIISFIRILKYLKSQSTKYFKIAIFSNVVVVFVILSILSIIFFKYNNNYNTVKYVNIESPDNIYNIAPKWLKTSINLPNDIFTNLWLKTNSQKIADFTNSSAKEFDVLTYIPSLFFDDNIDPKDDDKITNLLFDDKHTGFNRLWDGNNIETTSIEENVQIYPENHIAYTEAIIKIYNNNQYSEEEAIYTISLPKDSVATKLNLWIGDNEEEGILTLKSKARAAYNDVVGIQRRDPAVLEWVDNYRLRLNVFPVTNKNPRTVKIAYITPLNENNGKLDYHNMNIEGQKLDTCKLNLAINIFSENDKTNITGKNIEIKEKLSSDAQVRQFESKTQYKNNWDVLIEYKNTAGSYTFNDELYSIQNIKFKNINYIPDNIYVLLDKTLSKKEWKELLENIFKSKNPQSSLILVTDEFFETKSLEKIYRFLNEKQLPNFHLFPFYLLDQNKKNIIVTNYEKVSVSYTETKGSKFYYYLEFFFSKNKIPIYIASLSLNTSKYLNSLEEFNRITQISKSKEELFKLLKSGEIRIPDTENKVVFYNSNFTIEKSKIENKNNIIGNDLIPRLFYYKTLMNKLGERYFMNDTDHNDLLLYANDAQIVTPVSSFVVLENQSDYDKNDIKKVTSKFDKTNIQNKEVKGIKNKLGMVPEPHEWVLIIILIIVLVIFYRNFLLRLIFRKN